MSQPHKTVHARSLDRTWIVVADGGAARILTVAPDHSHLMTLRELTSPDIHHKTHDMVSDRGGRSVESDSTSRHGIQAKTDPHELAKERFVHDLGKNLCQHHAAGEFDVLVLVVTRAQVHTLETALNGTTKASVAGIVAKDLVKMPATEIWRHLTADGIMPPPLRPNTPHAPGA